MAKPIACTLCWHIDGDMEASVIPTIDFLLTIDKETGKVTFEYWPNGCDDDDMADKVEACEHHQEQTRETVIGEFLFKMGFVTDAVEKENGTWVDPEAENNRLQEIDELEKAVKGLNDDDDLTDEERDLLDGMDEDDKADVLEHLREGKQGDNSTTEQDDDSDDDDQEQEEDRLKREAWEAERAAAKAASAPKVNPFAKKVEPTPAPEVKPAGAKPPVKGATITQRPKSSGKLSATAIKRLKADRNARIRDWAEKQGKPRPSEKGRLDVILVHEYEVATNDLLPEGVV